MHANHDAGIHDIIDNVHVHVLMHKGITQGVETRLLKTALQVRGEAEVAFEGVPVLTERGNFVLDVPQFGSGTLHVGL